jgi:hypothetical protein
VRAPILYVVLPSLFLCLFAGEPTRDAVAARERGAAKRTSPRRSGTISSRPRVVRVSRGQITSREMAKEAVRRLPRIAAIGSFNRARAVLARDVDLATRLWIGDFARTDVFPREAVAVVEHALQVITRMETLNPQRARSLDTERIQWSLERAIVAGGTRNRFAIQDSLAEMQGLRAVLGLQPASIPFRLQR